MALLEKHLLNFNIHKDAKSLMEAIKKRFRADLKEQSLDDLFNNLKIYEAEVKGSSTLSQNMQNIAFVSSNNIDNTNDSVNAAPSVFGASPKAKSDSPQLDNKDLKQIDPGDLEEMDLNWQMAMLIMSARRFLKKSRRNLGANGTDTIGFDMSKVECYNCHRRGHFARECRSPRDNRNKETTRRTVPMENETVFEDDIKLLKLDFILRDNALAELRKNFEKAKKERNDLKLTLEKFENSSKNLSKLLESQVSDKTGLGFYSQVFDCQVSNYEELHSQKSDNRVTENQENDRYKPDEGYHVVPPLYTRKFLPYKPNLVFTDDTNGNPQQTLHDKGVIDSGCLRHMTRNIYFLLEFEEIDGGYVAFGGDPKGDTECAVLSSDYKLPDENYVFLRVLRENNMYFVDLKNVVPSGGIGPKWLFDIDTLTMSMNYQLVVVGNQPNDNAGIKENLDADDDVADDAFEVKENDNDVHVSAHESDKTDKKKHYEKAKRDDKGRIHVDSITRVKDLRAEFKEFSFNSTNRVNAVSEPFNAARPNPTNSTNSFNTANMAELEDIVYSDDEEDVGVEADLSNLETNIPISLIPTTRVHKDHLVNKIIGDLNSAPQTRSMTRMVKEQGGLNQLNDEDFHTYLAKGKRAICLKWVFRNKKDKRGIVIRNKARLVAQGHTQEEGIDYNEVFASVARVEAIRLFLAYAFFMGFMVYQMDVKSAFLYGAIREEVYVCQPLGFKDLAYPYEVYKVVKAHYRGKINQTLFIKKQKGDILLVQVYVDDIIFGSTNKELYTTFEKLTNDKFQMSSMGELTFLLGLQVKKKKDEIFISQDKYVAKILRKFGFTDVKSASTPIETEKPLLKDPDGPDFMFAVYVCARFQLTPKVSRFHAVKRIFRYLKGKPHLGLWYPRDSPFNLVAYSDSDYAEASLNRKSTTRGCQFLGCRLISWQCKMQTVVATSSTKTEYVAAASCCCNIPILEIYLWKLI
uniref:CCHC-type domain-containing protein n=1 Tax=Tanacetum cinerariifolium TaxID=118510 RepID=A0A699I4R6_TANCI|nr:hypothetical protein [Tanacetum cinerariifolium]